MKRADLMRGVGPTGLRIAGWAGALIAVPVTLLGTAALAVWLTLPAVTTTLHLPILASPVEVTLDGWDIPRIHARSEADAAAALGYLHASQRMFQMELMRRQASGRLAEIAGPRALRLDRMARILGERQHAAASYAALPAPIRAMLESYTAGVNAWITARGRLAAPEFLALGAPEPWTPVDCLLWSETVSLWLSDNYRTELSRMALNGKITDERMRQLWPPTDGKPAPDSTMPSITQGLLDALPAFPEPFTLPQEASNAWAVDGHHTSTGAALMAGDPHLALTFPGLWYIARIETPAGVLVGATAPGVPFLIIGRNAHIGWSFTTTGIDTQDVFVETPLPGGFYETPEGPRPFETRREVIHVRGAPDEVLTARATLHGPVISDADLDPHSGPVLAGPVLAVAMAQFKLGSPAPGLYALNHAASIADAGRAAAIMTAPMQNLTVAGPDGIALFTTGQVPIRRAGDGSLPVAGADGLHDWTGFAHGIALPHFVNPPSGTVENANERTAPPDFPVFLGRDFPAPLRARRIHELLAARPQFSVADFEAMQRDDTSVLAQDLLPIFRALPPALGLAGRAQALLATWDGSMRQDRPEPLIFNAAIQLFVARMLAANHVPEADAGPWGGPGRVHAGSSWRGLVRRRLPAVAGRRIGRRHAAAGASFRRGSGALALGHAAPGGVRAPAARRSAADRRLRVAPRAGRWRRHHAVPRRQRRAGGIHLAARRRLSRDLRHRQPRTQPLHRDTRPVRQSRERPCLGHAAALGGRPHHRHPGGAGPGHGALASAAMSAKTPSHEACHACMMARTLGGIVQREPV